MNTKDSKYTQYALSREMLQTVQTVQRFDPTRTAALAKSISGAAGLFLTGEGSSRIFPAKNAIHKALKWGLKQPIETQGSRQAMMYDLSRLAVMASSNSGRTSEVIVLMKKLKSQGHSMRFGLTANENTLLHETCNETFVLTCGGEDAVAATKSVAEQALFYQSVVSHLAGRNVRADLAGLDAKLQQALSMPIDPAIIKAAANAGTIYFAGLNDGVAEELTLKTNEITRKKSDFLEGTYAVHGIEEVMDKNDIVFVVDPIPEEMEKFKKVLVDGVGLKVVAIADRPTMFDTIVTPDAGEMSAFVQLCAGWNVLVEIGLALGINLDKPQRARKVGNEFVG
ncbi:MAG: sugar isomerase [Planctomycetes bacterium]|jgi:glucosamine--fructose-6-phosphate aminotransferase (isomerizing)|nr:sugar isomerase [Planctomycetota bacterium]